MMSPEAEAHKMIAISLGKIANSRIQRGGPKLFKNLLVANLIQKARVLVVEEPQLVETPQCESPLQSYDPEISDSVIDVGSELPNEFAIENNAKPLPVDVTPKIGLGEENLMQQGYDDTPTQEGQLVNVNRSEWDENNKENRPSNPEEEHYVALKTDNTSSNTHPKPLDSLTVPSEAPVLDQEKNRHVPLRCLKRRNHTSSEEENSEITSFSHKRYRSTTDQFNTKRWRVTSVTERELGLSDVESDSEDSLELKYPSKVHVLLSVELHCESPEYSSSTAGDTTSMETEQMSTLVSVFSSSFHGLGVKPNNNSNSTSIQLDFCAAAASDSRTYNVVDSLAAAAVKTMPNNDNLELCSKQAGSVLKVSFPENKPVAVLV